MAMSMGWPWTYRGHNVACEWKINLTSALAWGCTHRERERFITSFPAISGLIRCVDDPFWAFINETHHAYHVILPHEQHHRVCLRTVKEMGALARQKIAAYVKTD